MTLRPIFKQALNIVWHNPILWLFGFFAALFANNEINLIIINFNRINNWIDQIITFKLLKIQFQQIFSNFISSQTFNSVAIYNLSLGLIFVFLFLYASFKSQISIISLTNKISTKNKLVSSNKKFLWPVIGVYIIAILISYAFLYMLSLPFFYTIPIPIIVYIFLFLVLTFIIYFILRFTVLFIILEKEKLFMAIKKASIFFSKNWLISIKTSIILFLMAIIFGFVLLLIFIGTALPFLFLLNFFLYLKFIIVFQLLILCWIILLGATFIILGSIFSSFQFSVWTLLFLKIKNKK